MINSAQYQDESTVKVVYESPSGDIMRFVPVDEKNREYIELLEWVENGGIITAAP